MRKFILITISLVISSMSFAQSIDRTKAPAAGPAPKIQLGDYESFTLDNGLQVFLVENHKNPRVSWQLYVNRDQVIEGEHAGMQSMMGSLLMTGTSSKSKAEIDEATDFIGGSISTSAYGAFASSLTKHKETMLALMSDVILHPTFPQEELAKLKKQTISGLMANASDPAAISSNVSSVLTYGSTHPYGEVESPESVETITTAMCTDFYKTYFKPNVSYLIIVGDITKEEAQPLVEKYYGTWAKGDVPAHTYDVPKAPKSTQVAFVDKPGAVQSTISIVYPVDLKPGSNDVMAASVMNAILGNSGFMARLIQNIREDKAYTYGAYSSLSTNPLVGDFYAGAEVRNEVTDSAIVQFIYEMDKLKTDRVGDEELQNVKNYLNGRFARGMERSQTIARFALNTARYNLPADYYATYLERLQAVTAEDVLRVANKYLKPENAYIIVVGNKEEVASKLKVFATDGKINFYDAYGNAVADAKPIPSGVTVESVVNNYLNAIGNRADLEKIKSQDVEMTSTIQGMPVNLHFVTKGADKLSMTMKSGDMLIQQVTVNGSAGKLSGMMGKKDLTPEEAATYTEDNIIFDELGFNSTNAKLIHIEEINETSAYKMEVTKPSGNVVTYYYAVDSGLRIAKTEISETPQGPMVNSSYYSNYTDVKGVKVPFTTVVDNSGQVMNMQISKIELGTDIPNAMFEL